MFWSTPPAPHCWRPDCAFFLTREHLFHYGWSTLKNGELLRFAEENGFEVLVTTDTNLRYQQNLATRRIAVVVLSTTSWPRIRVVVERVASAVNAAGVGSYIEVSIP